MAPGAPGGAAPPAPGQAPISPDKLLLLELPTWEEVGALLENPVHREFRLDIETDSTIRMDEEQVQQATIQLVEMLGGFLDKGIQAGMAAPQIIPMLGEIMRFAIRQFRNARTIEQTFDDAMQALQQASKQPKPNPEMMKAQMEAQTAITIARNKAQLDAQVQSQKDQSEAKLQQITQQMEMAKQQHDSQQELKLEQAKAALEAQTQAHIQEMKNQFEAEKTQFETAAKIHIAEMQAHVDLAGKRMELDHQADQSERERKHAAEQGDKDREAGITTNSQNNDVKREAIKSKPKPGKGR